MNTIHNNTRGYMGIIKDRTHGIPMESAERFMFFFLAGIPEIGARTIRTLCSAVSPLSSILYTGRDELIRRLGLSLSKAAVIAAATENVGMIYEDYRRTLDSGIRMVVFTDRDFPERLHNIPNPPAVLFVKGKLPDRDRPAVSIVGSRCASAYGTGIAEYLGESLASAGVDIVSGMALGVDAAAHRGALKAKGGYTYGVMGGGVNVCYPKENYYLYDKILGDKRGGIISEMVPGVNNLKRNFPMRNRIISGLSDVVIVVEAKEKSGSLITVDAALDQGREVMAIPGRITDPMSRGCNELIKNGAHVLLGPEDVLDILGFSGKEKNEPVGRKEELLGPEEIKVYRALDTNPRYAQEVMDATGLSYQETVSILLDLELKGYISQVSAGYYGIIG